MVKKGSTGIATEKDLEGKIVGVQQGTTGEEYVEEEIDTKELRTFPQGPDTFPALEAGTLDAVVIDRPVAEKQFRETLKSKSRAGSKPKNSMGSWSNRATRNCLTNSTRR